MRVSDDFDSPREAIKATVARYNDRPDECTLHPAHPDSGKRTTEWVTAKRGAYVSLAAWR